MQKIVCIVKCKVCKYEIRSDWKFCPKCGDAIVCHKVMGTRVAEAKGVKKLAKKPAKKAAKK
jgi:RNA polymerase subunit RPABC4/transcription elongation factor Spt4